MTKDLRVVVDTNVLVSGLLGIKNSPSSKILKAVRNQKVILVTSPKILKEVTDVINRERIVKLTKMTRQERKEFIDKLIERSDITIGKQLSQIVSRDVKDDKFLACGVEGKVDYIISGDDDLLSLREFEGIRIVSPQQFVTLLEN
ncbi:MAG: putative toxin-antitoxin system toxin component, PIN family [Candidatus Levybacteria bacterium RIFCSPHIGHO2_02_FULL_37_13]|nr:MAG: putative toxin-antitoxin system toxin component, PIN family [Candidatus Levybacteria bacterium RIFCSPHIGHO2_02_FULL_37_13]OGH40697.1 MAG: putative toxin-antitoxin system toxin component, PIN family [Candidatus Levybacteria bacterium RIFCSPLOWO2_01_FULL_37_26]